MMYADCFAQGSITNRVAKDQRTPADGERGSNVVTPFACYTIPLRSSPLPFTVLISNERPPLPIVPWTEWRPMLP